MTYLLIVFSYMVLCVSFLVYENTQINKMQEERRGELQLEQMSNILERRIQMAQNIVTNLSYSSSMKQLYMKVRTGDQLDSYSISEIQSEMSGTLKDSALSIYNTVLFVEDSDRAYSSGGVIVLGEEYTAPDDVLPMIVVSSLNDEFRLSSNRYSFGKECLLYMDAYSWQNRTDIGTLCIMFDLKSITRDIKAALEEGCGIRILFGDTEIYSYGELEGRMTSGTSARMKGISYEVYDSGVIVDDVNRFYYTMLSGILLISILFAVLAYWESKRYYMPIDHLEQMVTSGEQHDQTEDEMEQIILGIQNLIGEKNGYREKMLTITPYAQTGMLHSMIAGNAAEDYVRIFLDENYLDLIKPYFVVSIVNFAYDGMPPHGEEVHKQHVKELLALVIETFSTDEIHLVYYFRDIYNVYLIVNCDSDQKNDDLFDQIYRHISTAMAKEFCYVTMGVDILRDDISELREACDGATKALDGVLTDGRGAVYFREDTAGKTNTYYFPVNFRERLARGLQRQDKDEIHKILYDIYKTNAAIDGTPEMYRSLIDEFHLSVIKTLREITELNTVHVNIAKYTGLATLQDIFDYYDAALISVIDALRNQAAWAEADSRLEEDIVSYIEANYCDADLSLQSLTDRFNVSNKYLSFLCKEHFGTTYLQYIQDKRIHKAAELLRSGQYSLTEIGTMCGYTNQLTFRRNFKRIMGVNPSDYLARSL